MIQGYRDTGYNDIWYKGRNSILLGPKLSIGYMIQGYRDTGYNDTWYKGRNSRLYGPKLSIGHRIQDTRIQDISVIYIIYKIHDTRI